MPEKSSEASIKVRSKHQPRSHSKARQLTHNSKMVYHKKHQVVWTRLQYLYKFFSIFFCQFTGDIRSDEESGPEDEKVEMDNRDGILQDGKKKQ